VLTTSYCCRILMLAPVSRRHTDFCETVVRQPFDAPLDGGLKFLDAGLFRGVQDGCGGLLSVACTRWPHRCSVLKWITGAGWLGLCSRSLSSFIKRHSTAARTHATFGLDQVRSPAAAAAAGTSRLSGGDIAFVLPCYALRLLLSRLLFKLHIRPALIRSSGTNQVGADNLGGS